MRRASQRTAPPLNQLHPWDARLVFDLTTAIQSNWRGVCADYMGFGAFPELGESGAVQTEEFDRAELSGIKMARTWFDGGWALPDWPDGVADYASTDMGYFYTWLTAMQERDIGVILTMGWHFPGNVCELSRGTVPECTPTPADEVVWAHWVSDSLGYIMNTLGYTNIVGCFFFVEPPFAATNVPVGYTPVEYYAHLLTIARAQITADDAGRTPVLPRILVMGSEEFSFTTFDWLPDLRADYNSLFSAYTGHRYCATPEFPPLGLVAANCAPYATWISQFQADVALAAPKEFWADEGGSVLAGEDDDSTGYRKTADAGMTMVKQIDGHMQAGCAASFLWMIQDQRWFFDADVFLEYGAAFEPGEGVKAAWYAFATHANLTGGGAGTSVYACTGGTGDIHGTAVFVPFGLRHTVNPAGEWSFVVINEDRAADVQIEFPETIGGRTVYRYNFSGEMPPTAALNPDLTNPWVDSYENITTSLPLLRVQGRSITIFSTMDVWTPVAVNLALTATASTDSPGPSPPSYVNDCNWSNVTGPQNGWKKTTDAAKYVQLDWLAAQTVGRIELAFVATTPGVVFATGINQDEPNPVADYTLEYWDGADWIEIVDVTANTSPNRSHTFTPVETTKIRLTVNSVAVTGQVNQMGAYAE